uniref:sphingosine-1-phosphate phosphatase 2-like n=1 Tax=Styela clava TaxID=7725 RepID=UPI00193AD1AC|nr:sphingosine-1-phosphate phosphatase 2-like [Styela clava]
MEAYNRFIDYFMDFHKVRKFQEFCGLSAIEPSQDSQSSPDQSTGISSKNSQHTPHDASSPSYANAPMKSVPRSCQENKAPKKQPLNYAVNNKFLHHLFLMASMLGTEVFYITGIPIIFWNLDMYMARMVITVWVVTMYLGQAAKDLLRWPRPTWPPVFKLETRVEAEYGLPSTHAIAATSVPFTLFITAIGRYDVNIPLCFFLATCWCLLVSLSRLYVGMHSILDVMAGIALATAYLYFGWPFMEMVNDYTIFSKYAPYIIIISHFLLAIFYPIDPDRWSTSRGDTVIILGVGAGVHCASWFGNYYGFNWEPAGEMPYAVALPTLYQFGIGVVRYVFGIAVLLLVRALMKYISLLILCHAVSVPKDDEMSRRRTEIEVPYKFVTYACVGFSANFIVPMILQHVGLVL